MADWISASTPEFWQESADQIYLGEGQWELAGYEVLSPSASNPITVASKSVWGIKFVVTGGSLVSGYILEFFNYGAVYPAIASHFEFLLNEIDRTEGEKINYFEPGLWRGVSNGYDNVIISGIELYTDYIPEIELDPCAPCWTSYINTTEECQEV